MWKALAVGIGFRILLGQGLERVGLTGLLGGSLLGFPAGLIRFGLLGILDGFGLGAEISLPGYGLGDLRRGGLTSRFQGRQALLESSLLLGGFSAFHGVLTLGDPCLCGFGLGFCGFHGISQAASSSLRCSALMSLIFMFSDF